MRGTVSYFLRDLGLQKEFVDALCNYLKHWTANVGQKQIYQGHGIPQGPLSSGLLAEVVLRYFDENRSTKQRSWRYFRYVDDIRFFAKNEQDLRAMIVEMDMLSKQIGLFPQSGKINIKKVIDIEEEIKSVSHPPEVVTKSKSPDQPKIQKRLIELSQSYIVKNETRFKYVLASAEPSAKLSHRLLKILVKQPHMYFSIFGYFEGYTAISKKLSKEILDVLKNNSLYPAFTSYGLRILNYQCHPDIGLELERYVQSLLNSSSLDIELRALSTAVLLRRGVLAWNNIEKNFSSHEFGWWYKAELARYVDISRIGHPSYQSLMNKLLTDHSNDVSLVASELLAINALNVTTKVQKINDIAQFALKSMQLIAKRRGKREPITDAMKELFGNGLNSIDWKIVLGNHYKGNISTAVQLKAYAETDATSWVLLIDTFHDDLLHSLFLHEASAIGNYNHGNIGSVFNPGSRFQLKYPLTFLAFKKIHEKRLDSRLSHPVNRKSGKRTRFVEYQFISDIKPELEMAYREIWRKR